MVKMCSITAIWRVNKVYKHSSGGAYRNEHSEDNAECIQGTTENYR